MRKERGRERERDGQRDMFIEHLGIDRRGP